MRKLPSLPLKEIRAIDPEADKWGGGYGSNFSPPLEVGCHVVNAKNPKRETNVPPNAEIPRRAMGTPGSGHARSKQRVVQSLNVPVCLGTG